MLLAHGPLTCSASVREFPRNKLVWPFYTAACAGLMYRKGGQNLLRGHYSLVNYVLGGQNSLVDNVRGDNIP